MQPYNSTRVEKYDPASTNLKLPIEAHLFLSPLNILADLYNKPLM